MTDRPITFRASMVRALLDGRKSQTRRILGRTGEGRGRYNIFNPEIGWSDGYVLGDGNASWRERDTPWKIGDRLYVREAHSLWADAASARAAQCIEGTDDPCIYRADYMDGTDSVAIGGTGWRSPVAMPRWASRLTLIVTDVRVQRVQSITEADARAEGATSRPECHGFCLRNFGWSMDWSRVGTLSRWASVPPGSPRMNPLKESDISLGDPRMAFASYWNDLHGPDAWDANPWVAALTFTTHRQNIDRMEPTNGN